jgi:hypothetical protein
VPTGAGSAAQSGDTTQTGGATQPGDRAQGARPTGDTALRDFRHRELGTVLAGALSAQQAGRLDEAMALYREALGRDPDHFDALHMLGVCEYMRGELASAERHVERALRVRPDIVMAVRNLDLVRRARYQGPDQEFCRHALARVAERRVAPLSEAAVSALGRGRSIAPVVARAVEDDSIGPLLAAVANLVGAEAIQPEARVTDARAGHGASSGDANGELAPGGNREGGNAPGGNAPGGNAPEGSASGRNASGSAPPSHSLPVVVCIGPVEAERLASAPAHCAALVVCPTAAMTPSDTLDVIGRVSRRYARPIDAIVHTDALGHKRTGLPGVRLEWARGGKPK